MAYFRKRGKSWSYTIDIGKDPVTGGRKQKTKTGFKSKKEAQTAAAEDEIKLAKGTYRKGAKIPFVEFAESWLKYYESTGRVKPGTIRVRRCRIGALKKYFAGLQMHEITKLQYQNALIDMKEKGAAHATLNSTHVTAKMIFAYAIEVDVLEDNPALRTKIPKKRKTVEEIEQGVELPKYFEKDQLALFLNAAKRIGKDKDFAAFTTLAYTGIRIGELCALRFRDIDFEEKTISITKTYYTETNSIVNYQILPPKTEGSIRVVEIDDYLASVLQEHLTIIREFKMRHRDAYHTRGKSMDDDFVFPIMTRRKNEEYLGYPCSQKHFERRMQRILEIEGMELHFTPHSFRHTHTTLLAEAGVGLQEIMDRLGHKDDEVTRNVYLHVTKTMKRGAADKFGSLMKNVVKA